MDNKELSQIRHLFRKTQAELARLLCVSPKAIQSFEQGWRNIPVSVERQLLFLVSLKRSLDENTSPCWKIRNCPDKWRDNCIVWELQARHFCWFINGTVCEGAMQESWAKKIKLCRQCGVYKSMLPAILSHNPF
ncbi:helix-turn-helix domain-containing protein [Chloroflexota bacterium]